jgi:hypothetical protein
VGLSVGKKPTRCQPLFTHADSSHHPAGLSAFTAIREKQVGMASRAVAGVMNRRGLESRSRKLSMGHGGEVKMQVGALTPMPWRRLGVK